MTLNAIAIPGELRPMDIISPPPIKIAQKSKICPQPRLLPQNNVATSIKANRKILSISI
jgi:hypothetical protein